MGQLQNLVENPIPPENPLALLPANAEEQSQIVAKALPLAPPPDDVATPPQATIARKARTFGHMHFPPHCSE